MCKSISSVSCFSDCLSFENIRHKNENNRSDSAFDNGITRQISSTCKRLLIPRSFPIWNIASQHFSGVLFKRYLLIWSYKISNSGFKYFVLQELPSSSCLKWTATFSTSLEIISISWKLYACESRIMLMDWKIGWQINGLSRVTRALFRSVMMSPNSAWQAAKASSTLPFIR